MATYTISSTIDYSSQIIPEVDAVTFLPFLGTGLRTATFHLSQLAHSEANPPPITITGGLGRNELVLKLEPINGVRPDSDLLDDLVFVNWGADDRLTLIGGQETDFISGTIVDDMIFGSGGDDHLFGGAGGNDTLYGGTGEDWLYYGSGDGREALFGGTGNDFLNIALEGQSASINISTGTGTFLNCEFADIEQLIYSVTGGTHTAVGGALFDLMAGFGAAAVSFSAGGGNDEIRIADGTVGSVDGGTGVDLLTLFMPYEPGDPSVGLPVALSINISDGGGGRDVGYGLTVTNVEQLEARGGRLNDSLRGGALADTLTGNEGNDTIIGGAGGDYLSGGDGTDTVSYQYAFSAVNVNLGSSTATGGEATGDIVLGFENLTGGLGNDTLTGSSVANVLVGNGGADRLTGEAGADTLTGGSGADVFVFAATGDSTSTASDRITDFVRGSDRIDLGGIDASTLALGNNAFSFIGTGSFTGIAGQLRYSTSLGTTTVLGDTDGNGAADLRILLTGDIPLTASDFLL